MTTPDTRERRAIRESAGSTPDDRRSPRGHWWAAALLAAVFVIQVILVAVVFTQHERFQQELRTDVEDRSSAVASIICVLQLPQVARTDENVTRCLEEIEPAD